MRYGSVCSGIEAATVAWEPLGWEAAFFSEIEAFPRAVLNHHYPEVPLHHDFTTIGADQYGAIELLVGGTPCQSFSVAGLRGGMADSRGNLALEYLRLAERKRPKWLVWENVPGVLSSNEGRDFGSLLGGLGELGYGWAYRVLDAQYFGVPQRHRRVFVVGYLGDWRPPTAVLFNKDCLRRNSAPRREAGQRVADTITVGANQYSGFNGEPVEHIVMSSGQANAEIDVELSPALNCNRDGAPIAFKPSEVVAVSENVRGEVRETDVTQSLAGQGGKPGQGYAAARVGMVVRRLTPTECERLQGFPDDYTAIPYRNKGADKCPDGPRYRALGNSMAVPVMHWIGRRIDLVKREMAVAKLMAWG
jgi:DNA (cytosine-5)-methyltransferase 1